MSNSVNVIITITIQTTVLNCVAQNVYVASENFIHFLGCVKIYDMPGEKKSPSLSPMIVLIS